MARRKKPGPERQWTDERIERELRKVVCEFGRWPSSQELRDTGRSALATAITTYGGVRQWARRLGYEPGRAPGEIRWTEKRVRIALEDFLRGQVRWPTGPEFRAAGLGGLHRALQRRGETARWAKEFGLEPPRTGRPPKR